MAPVADQIAGSVEKAPPVRGVVAALQEMESEGFKVLLVAAPNSSSSPRGKVHWIKKHLGENWLERLVLCTDEVSKVVTSHRPDWFFSALYMATC